MHFPSWDDEYQFFIVAVNHGINQKTYITAILTREDYDEAIFLELTRSVLNYRDIEAFLYKIRN
jgi:hypothetical protein